jgi:glycosyltransferase involved in cell wall biosynthesis
MRILMVTPRCLPEMGGIETHVHEVGRRLADRGHSVHVLATDRTGGLPAREVVAGMAITRVPAWPRTKDYYFAPAIARAIAKGDWDVVHIQGGHTLVPPLALLAALRRHIPVVVTFHSGGHSSALRTLLRRGQWAALAPLMRRASHWIGVSRYEAQFFTAAMGLDPARVSIVPNGAEMPRPAQPQAPLAEGRLIVSIGRLERYKGHHRVIAAFPELLRHCPDARLRVLGEGPYKDALRRQAEHLHLEDRIQIAGIPPAERDRLAAVLSSAALVVLLSDFEAHPVAVMEALALGRPVLVAEGSGFTEMAEQGLVRAVPAGAGPARIAAAMAEELGRAHAPIPVALPTWDGCTDRVEAIYRDVARQTQPASSSMGYCGS